MNELSCASLTLSEGILLLDQACCSRSLLLFETYKETSRHLNTYLPISPAQDPFL